MPPSPLFIDDELEDDEDALYVCLVYREKKRKEVEDDDVDDTSEARKLFHLIAITL